MIVEICRIVSVPLVIVFGTVLVRAERKNRLNGDDPDTMGPEEW